MDLKFSCRCGQVNGVVANYRRSQANRVVCYCGDCRGFVNWLKQPDHLDARGGVDILHLAQGDVRIDQGRELVACMRLSPKGMFRFYATCCSTPLGSTVSAGLPLVGFSTTIFDSTVDREPVLGPALVVNGASALGGPMPERKLAVVGMMMRVGALLARWKIMGRGKPSPFFSDQGQPVAAPMIITKEQRAALATPAA